MLLGILLYVAIAVFAFAVGMYALGACSTVVAVILFVIDYKCSAYDGKYTNKHTG